jgi:hypothetical protein
MACARASDAPADGNKQCLAAILEIRDYFMNSSRTWDSNFSPRLATSPSIRIVTVGTRARTRARFLPPLRKQDHRFAAVARENGEWLRFSMHFYNTRRKWSALPALLRAAIA